MAAINNHINVEEVKVLLQDDEKKFIDFIKNMKVGIALYNQNTIPILCNVLAYKLLGLEEDQFLGITPMDPYWQIIKEDNTKFEPYDFPIIEVTTTYKPIYETIMGVKRPEKNDLVWLEVNTEPILERTGELKYIVCSYRDITKEKLASK